MLHKYIKKIWTDLLSVFWTLLLHSIVIWFSAKKQFADILLANFFFLPHSNRLNFFLFEDFLRAETGTKKVGACVTFFWNVFSFCEGGTDMTIDPKSIWYVVKLGRHMVFFIFFEFYIMLTTYLRLLQILLNALITIL